MKKQGLIMGSFVLMLAAVVSKIFGLLFRIPLTNLLGGEGMGYYSSAYTVFTPVYAICAGSITPAIAQYVSRKSATADRSKLISVRNSSLIVFGGFSLAVSTAMMLLSGFIARRIIGNQDAKLAIVAIAPCVFVEAITSVYRGYFEGKRNMTPTAISQAVEAITRVLFGLGFALLAREQSLPVIAAMAVWGVTASNVAGLIFLIIRSGRDKAGAVISSKDAIKQITGLMVPIALASLASSVMSGADLACIVLGIKASLKESPELYVQKYSEVTSSGIELENLPNFLYGTFTGLSYTVFTFVPSLCGVFGRSALPSITHDMAKGDMDSVRKEIKRMILITVYISLPAGLGISVFAKEALQILFSSKPVEVGIASLPLSVLGLGAVFLCLSGTVFSLLQGVGRQELPVKITVGGAILKLILNLILIPMPSMGLLGAAIASVASFGLMGIWGVISLYRIVGIKATPLYSVVIPAVGSCISILGAKYAEILIGKRLANVLTTGISVCFAVIIYIIILLLLDKTTKNGLWSKLLAK